MCNSDFKLKTYLLEKLKLSDLQKPSQYHFDYLCAFGVESLSRV